MPPKIIFSQCTATTSIVSYNGRCKCCIHIFLPHDRNLECVFWLHRKAHKRITVTPLREAKLSINVISKILIYTICLKNHFAGDAAWFDTARVINTRKSRTVKSYPGARGKQSILGLPVRLAWSLVVTWRKLKHLLAELMLYQITMPYVRHYECVSVDLM